MSRLLEKGMVAGSYFVGRTAPGQCPKGYSLSLTANTGYVGRGTAPAGSEMQLRVDYGLPGRLEIGRPGGEAGGCLLPGEATWGGTPGA